MKQNPLSYLKSRITRIISTNNAVEEQVGELQDLILATDRKRAKLQIALNLTLSLILVVSSAIVVVSSREAANANRNYAKLLSAFTQVEETNNEIFNALSLMNESVRDNAILLREVRTWEYNAQKDMIELKRANCELKKALETEKGIRP